YYQPHDVPEKPHIHARVTNYPVPIPSGYTHKAQFSGELYDRIENVLVECKSVFQQVWWPVQVVLWSCYSPQKQEELYKDSIIPLTSSSFIEIRYLQNSAILD